MMTELASLWLPILLSAAGVFVASFIFWAVTPWHHKDVLGLPDPQAADRAVEGLGLPPGYYMLGSSQDRKECGTQAFKDRMERGPWGAIHVFPGKPNMGRNMALTFLTFLVVSVLVGYLAAAVLPPGAETVQVLRMTGIAAVLAYTFGGMANAIWFAKPLGWVVRDVIDALVYAAITAALFAWLWPQGVAGM